MTCTHCGAEVRDDARFCDTCGSSLVVDDLAATVEAPVSSPPPPLSPTPSSASSSSSRSDSGSWSGVFPPGSLFAGRYRIAGLLGRGGMGEVYRADDLQLDHPVAIKLLPPSLAQNPDRILKFRQEVRLARQISHANVCRVYDIGEGDGHHYLTMEYIDGEDLRALLRRIGRLPGDKAVEIARQICAGLSASHDKGVLHRDLKPANIMLDGEGNVRITDFGLAALSESIGAHEIRSGTPAYMAPEQLKGEEVSAQSDLYSLGLVLYEIFTGHQTFQADTVLEFSRMHAETRPENPTELVAELDPAVERVILRCLEKLPEDRPASAIAVAAALPGGDPLAAALAAGEIPSPEMVAASGSATDEVSTRYLWALLPALAGLLTMAGFSDLQLESRVPMEKAPAVLVDRAHELTRAFGGSVVLQDTDWGFIRDREYLRHIEATDSSLHRWDRLERADSPVVYLWFRTSPRDLDPDDFDGMVGWNDPTFNVSNMTRMLLNAEGNLRQYERVVPQREDSVWTPSGEVDYAPFFAAAGFDPAEFTPTDPLWNPEVYCDSRAAWEGSWVDDDTLTVRIEAGTYRGELVYWETVWPWTSALRMEPPPVGGDNRVIFFVSIGLFVSLVIGSVILARQNIKHGKGDRRGATRLALVMYVAHMIRWLLSADHIMSAQELGLFFAGSGFALVQAALVWLVYMALEPYLRRHAPDTLVSWVRVLKGQFSDRRVARDTLVGMTGAIVLDALGTLAYAANRWMGRPLEIPPTMVSEFMTSPRHALAVLFDCVGNGSMNGLLIVLIFTVMLMMSRRGMRIGAGVIALGGAAMLPFEAARMVGVGFILVAVVTLLLSFLSRFRRGVAGMVVFIFSLGAAQVSALVGNVAVALLLGALFAVVLVAIMVRYGVWAYVVTSFFNIVFSVGHLRFDHEPWFSYASIMLWVLVLVIAAWSARLIVRRRPPGYAA